MPAKEKKNHAYLDLGSNIEFNSSNDAQKFFKELLIKLDVPKTEDKFLFFDGDVRIETLEKSHSLYSRNYTTTLLGLKLSVSEWNSYKRSTTIRKVYFKDGKIDKTDFSEKFKELEAIGVTIKKAKENKDLKAQQDEKTRQEIIKEAGFTKGEVDVMRIKVDGSRVHLAFDTTQQKAVQILKILKTQE